MTRSLFLTLGIIVSVAGCEQLPEIPLTEDSTEAPDGQEATAPVAVSMAPPLDDQPTLEQSPEQIIAAFKAMPSTQLTAEDILKLTGLSSGLDQIQELNLQGSRLNAAALAGLGKLPALRKLDLQTASFGGGNLAAVAQLSNLEWLDVSRTATNNSEMQSIAKMTGLKSLNVAQTVINDDGLALLNQLSSLEELDFSSTETVGLGLAALAADGAKAPLRILRASQTRIGAQGFRVVNQFQLEELHVSRAMVTDGSLTGLKGCTKLKVIDLSFNQITDAGTKPLQALKELENINLARNPGIGDTTLRRLQSLPNLKFLDLTNTACSAEGVQAFKKRKPDCEIRVGEQTR